jgi:transcriptional regulator with XRE-family HTH domain
MSRTLREWREYRGISREELAERVGVTASMIERWEDIGLDYEPGSRAGDYIVGKFMDALEIEEGLRLEHVPSEPKPGDLVITGGPGVDIEDLIERAEELNVRIAVPDRFGLSLKPLKDGLTEEDFAALAEYHERERAYSEGVVKRMEAAMEMLGGNTGEWKPGMTMGERLEEVGRELGEDLDGQSPSGGVGK